MHAWDNLKNPRNFHFSIHAHAFLIDAASASPSGQPLKALKTALADYKSEIIDVSRLPELLLCSRPGHTDLGKKILLFFRSNPEGS